MVFLLSSIACACDIKVEELEKTTVAQRCDWVARQFISRDGPFALEVSNFLESNCEIKSQMAEFERDIAPKCVGRCDVIAARKKYATSKITNCVLSKGPFFALRVHHLGAESDTLMAHACVDYAVCGPLIGRYPVLKRLMSVLQND